MVTYSMRDKVCILYKGGEVREEGGGVRYEGEKGSDEEGEVKEEW